MKAGTPPLWDFPLPQKQPGPFPLPHGMGKWDANLPNPQNSNIAQFNSFSTLVALKVGVGETKLIEFKGVGRGGWRQLLY